MPIKDFAFLESPPASDFNRYFMQQEFIRKTANESVSSSTTSQDDDHLFFTPILNTDYWITMYIIYDGTGPDPTAGGDLKISWSVPTGSTFDYISDAITSTATGGVYDVSRTAQIAPAGGTPGAGTLGTGSPAVALVKGLFRMGATPGTFRFRWSQVTSNATAVTVRANSCLIARRLTT